MVDKMVSVRLSPDQQKRLDKIRTKFADELGLSEITASDALRMLLLRATKDEN